MGVFHNLGLGFEVPGLARCVDDLTLQRDLDKKAAPKSGWYRVVSDDRRLLHLAKRHCSPAEPIDGVLDPLARIFGTKVQQAGGLYRLPDPDGRAVAMAAPLPGERERACELITEPLGPERESRLRGLVQTADELGFRPAYEGATHIHLDGAHLRDPKRLQAFARRWLEVQGDFPRSPQHRRVGPWSEELCLVLLDPGFARLDWLTASARLKGVSTKYCDLNLRGLADGGPTVELRVLPASMDVAFILEWVERFVALSR